MVQHTQLLAFQKRGKKGVEKGEEGRKSWRALTHGPLAPPTTLMPHRSPGDLSKRLDQQLLQRTSRGHETAQNLLRHHATKPNRNLELDSQRQRAHQKQVTQAGCCINPSIRQPVGPPVQFLVAVHRCITMLRVARVFRVSPRDPPVACSQCKALQQPPGHLACDP